MDQEDINADIYIYIYTHTDTVEYCSTIKNKSFPFVTVWMDRGYYAK